MRVARPTILLDCDPGHDDAVAIALAGQLTDLIGITTVSGNVGLHMTTRNALVVTQIADLDVPVWSGADRPLVAPPSHAAEIHGNTGLDGVDLPDVTGTVAGTDAVGEMARLAEERPDAWFVPIGPLTNVALAMRANLALPVAGLSIMGGSLEAGNSTRAAEFNVWADPEAAAAVFGSGLPLVMCGLDLTRQFYVDDLVLGELAGIGNGVSSFLADLLRSYLAAVEARGGVRRAALHDPCAVLALTNPELFGSERLHVEIELTGTHTRGATVADRRDFPGSAEPNVTVMTEIDRTAAMSVLLEAIARY